MTPLPIASATKGMSMTPTLGNIAAASQAFEPELFLQACHVLAAQGHAVGLAGQVSQRAQTEGHVWTLALGAGLEEASLDSLLLVDSQMRTQQGEGQPNPGVRFHQWIYAAYPQVQAIVHTHPPALSALSMLGKPMPVAHMGSGVFYEDCGFLGHWPGVPTGDEEGLLISQALLGKRCAFLVNHGIVCTGASLQEAIYLNVFAERNARISLDALAAGTLQAITPEAAQEAHDFLLQPSIINATFDYWARCARRQLRHA
jgi:L-fuculose-phosphate aldolase